MDVDLALEVEGGVPVIRCECGAACALPLGEAGGTRIAARQSGPASAPARLGSIASRSP